MERTSPQNEKGIVLFNKKQIALVFIVAALAGSAAFSIFSSRRSSGSTIHPVVLGEQGFFPVQLIIRKGDTVEFASEQGKEFWPASDLHPTHTIYPEFDPKRPIKPGERWSFRFDRVGTWRYHDHLDPLYRGTIVVSESAAPSASSEECSGEQGERLTCWRNQVEATLNREGVGPAFEQIAQLYTRESGFQNECHSFAHLVGQRAAELFLSGKDVPLSPKTAYCGYGFYHGFMETLLHQGGDSSQAREFCAYAGKQLEKETADAEGACYHGIGHGAVDGGDPRTWGDPQAMIASAVDLCEKIGDSLQEDWRCVTGAYNAVEVLSLDAKYKITSFRKDPFPFCNSQPFEYQDGCYQNMIIVLPMRTDEEFLSSARRIERAAGSEHRAAGASGILSLFHEYIRVNLQSSDYVKRGLAICRALGSKDFHVACIEGLSGGHFKYAEPEREYIQGLAFCANSLLTGDEREICFSYNAPRLRNHYSEQKSREICESLPQEYQRFCPVFPQK